MHVHVHVHVHMHVHVHVHVCMLHLRECGADMITKTDFYTRRLNLSGVNI